MTEKKDRKDLKEAFEAGRKPSGTDFANLIDSVLNSQDDGIEKPSGISQPLKILPHGDEQNLLDFGGTGDELSWRINRKPENKASGFNLSLNGESKLFIENDTGHIGIGTVTPKSLLHISQDLCLGKDENNARFIIHSRSNNNGDYLHITNDNSNGSWDWSNGLKLRRNGNVGIGDILPEQKLHIDGAIKCTEGIIFPDNSKQTSAVKIESGSKNVTEGLGYGSGDRVSEDNVIFVNSFSKPPAIVAAISVLDASGSTNLRIDCWPTDITNTSFKLKIRTWGDTHIYRVSVSWIAFGA